MKAITIRQPWANLLVCGKKRFETRTWETNYRGKLAIHVSKQVDDFDFDFKSEFDSTKQKIIAIAELRNVHLITDEMIDNESQTELNLGLWEPGNFAWELSNIQPLTHPIPAVGKPGLWDFPDERLVFRF